MRSHQTIDFCFLGNDRLLVISDELELYSIQDVYTGKVPQLLARFMLPVDALSIQCHLPFDDIAHSPESSMQAQQAMWASDPKHRLLCLSIYMHFSYLVAMISTNIFFDLDLPDSMVGQITIPWGTWGPSNTRIFPIHYPWKVSVSGNRSLYLSPAHTSASDLQPPGISKSQIHILDFSPLAVERRQGRGTLVTGTSKIRIPGPFPTIMSSLPYVEAVLEDRPFGSDRTVLLDIWINKDKLILLTDATVGVGSPYFFNKSDLLIISGSAVRGH